MYKLPERGGGGGREVIRAMPERKHSFLKEVFPLFETSNYVGLIVGRVRLVQAVLLLLQLNANYPSTAVCLPVFLHS